MRRLTAVLASISVIAILVSVHLLARAAPAAIGQACARGDREPVRPNRMPKLPRQLKSLRKCKYRNRQGSKTPLPQMPFAWKPFRIVCAIGRIC